MVASETTTATGRDAQRRDRLIVVEDDPVTRAMIAGYFADHNFDVVEAGSCGECRAVLKRGRVDLIFLDVQLPDGDGFEFAKEAQTLSRAGIIFVTRRDTEVDRILGLERISMRRFCPRTQPYFSRSRIRIATRALAISGPSVRISGSLSGKLVSSPRMRTRSAARARRGGATAATAARRKRSRRLTAARRNMPGVAPIPAHYITCGKKMILRVRGIREARL